MFFPFKQDVSVSIPSSQYACWLFLQKKLKQIPEVSQKILKWKEPVTDVQMEMGVK